MKMSKNRIKTTALPVLQTTEQVEEALANCGHLQSYLAQIEGEMNQQIIAVREQYAPRIDATGARLELETEALRAYADAHGELFAVKKSTDYTHGTIGYRTGTPKLKPLKGWTWDRVLEKVRQCARAYLRVKEEVNKEALLADRETLGADRLKALGVAVAQDETFFVTPKLEEVAK
jgi:phage host-nuclease inhibitor protein Gam